MPYSYLKQKSKKRKICAQIQKTPKLYYQKKKKLWTKSCVFWTTCGIEVVEKKETIVICLNIYKETAQSILKEISPEYSLEGLMLKLKLHLMRITDSLTRKDPDAGKDWWQEEKGTTEDEMVGWHDQLDGHDFGYAPGVGNGQGGLACCGPCVRKDLDTTE